MGKKLKKEPKSVEFFLQLDGEQYSLKFNLLKSICHQGYTSEKCMMKGTDVALAAFKVDRSDPKFTEEKLKDIKVPPIGFVTPEQIQDLKSDEIRVHGYPLEVYDPKTQLMGPNENFLYKDEGKLERVNTHGDLSGATAIYAFDEIVTGRG